MSGTTIKRNARSEDPEVTDLKKRVAHLEGQVELLGTGLHALISDELTPGKKKTIMESFLEAFNGKRK